jgi:hypothetical protein
MSSRNILNPGLDVPPMTVPAHNLARWIHSKLEVRNGMMRWEVPRTIVGLVPVGKRLIEVPAADISHIRMGRAVRPLGLTAGILAILLPLWLGWGWWAVLTIPLGLWTILVALGPRMEATTHTGRAYRADVCFGHAIDADLYMAAVEDIASPRA